MAKIDAADLALAHNRIKVMGKGNKEGYLGVGEKPRTYSLTMSNTPDQQESYSISLPMVYRRCSTRWKREPESNVVLIASGVGLQPS